jgi:hypothetical protein
MYESIVIRELVHVRDIPDYCNLQPINVHNLLVPKGPLV